MIAQIQNVDPNHLKDFLIIVLAIGSPLITLFVSGRKRSTEVFPHPLEVKAAEEFVKRADCVTLHEETVRRVAAIERQIIACQENRLNEQKNAGDQRKAIYDHIDAVRVELSDKIDAMPDRVIAILRNTGALT